VVRAALSPTTLEEQSFIPGHSLEGALESYKGPSVTRLMERLAGANMLDSGEGLCIPRSKRTFLVCFVVVSRDLSVVAVVRR
jgi:hypothetical protein